jgi:hypothetical protein
MSAWVPALPTIAPVLLGIFFALGLMLRVADL